MKKNFVFFGTPEFAAIVLQKLLDGGFVPTAVICNPDRPVGRKKIVTPPPTKLLALKHGIQVLQPENLSSLYSILSAFEADFAVVASYAKIIPKNIIEIFPKGIIGVHPSLLPKYRGPSPIQSVILAGEAEVGVTLYLLDEKIDHGPVLAISKLKSQISKKKLKSPISNLTYGELYKELAELGGELLVKTIPDYLAGKIVPQTQDESQATYTKKFSTEDAFVPPDELEKALAGDLHLAELIDRKIRALNPEPGVWTTRGGKRTKLLEATLRGGRLILKKIQVEGEKPKTGIGTDFSVK